ncbi:MAG: class I SAM-dependent methyltransferase [Deltaproteobacteria bacterium]|nr:class I SAM-dependent methyltransferase [Deltaproteobacteria bacterium]
MILQNIVERLKAYTTAASSLGLDLYFRVETRGTVSVETLGTPAEFSDRYAPVAWFGLPPILRQFNIGANDVFVDLGCGKGRALFVAARFPFARVIGVELAESLAVAARRNCESFLRRRNVPCREIQIVHVDAAEFEIPADATVVFLFNPFRDVPLDRVLQNLRASVFMNPRTLRIIYHDPVFHKKVLAALADLVSRAVVRDDYVVYELQGPETTP